MTRRPVSRIWKSVGTQLLPFADAASETLPFARLIRLSLFQVSVGIVMVLLMGTLNRVMIVEMGVSAALVATMVALPVLIAPFRAFLGFRSDHHRSAIGWRRSPYIWFGALLMFCGLAIMPFSLIALSGDHNGPEWIGPASAALAFLVTGAGMHTTQTAGLALATDLATEETRPRVVALLYVMLLIGMGISAAVFGWLLSDFSQVKLIQVIQGAAGLTMVLNLVALWKQESLKPANEAARQAPRPAFRDAWQDFMAGGQSGRLLAAVALGTMGFTMQDILLEPYGGEVLNLGVAATTVLTALWAIGSLAGLRAGRADAGPGCEPVQARRLWRHGRGRRVLGRYLCAADAIRDALPRRRGPDRFRRRAVRRGHVDGGHDDGTIRGLGPRARCLGRCTSHRRRDRRRAGRWHP